MEFRVDDPCALSTPSDAVRYAKKIKLTPPDDFSDWDGERSGEEQERADREGSNDGSEEPHHSLPRGNQYADAARNLMQAMRDARSVDGESGTSTFNLTRKCINDLCAAVSTMQPSEGQEEGDMDLDEDDELKSSSGSTANDYRRRGADLMAQLREEFSDDEEGSMRDGSIMTRDGSTNGGSLVIQGLGTLQPRHPNRDALSPSDLVVNRSPFSSVGRRSAQSSLGRRCQAPDTQNRDPVAQLASSMRAVNLDDRGGSIQSSPRKLPRKLSVVDEVSHVAVQESGLIQPPRITVVTASPEPPRAIERLSFLSTRAH